MYTVTIEGSFSAVHQVRMPDGSLEPLHGHDWRVEVTCHAAELDDLDMVTDFVSLKAVLDELLSTLVDGNLNTHPLLKSRTPTAERVAEAIFLALEAKGVATLYSVAVTEAPGCQAKYMPRA